MFINSNFSDTFLVKENNMNQEKIGKFILELRKEKNMTQQQLGDKIGVSFKTISKWENGRGMPELSLLRPLCEELGITVNEILSGERIKKENYVNKLEENMINTIEYSEKQKEQKNKVVGIILLIAGVLITLTAIAIFESESSWSSIYSIFGGIVALVGFSRIIIKLKHPKRLILNFSFFIVYIVLLFIFGRIKDLALPLNLQQSAFPLQRFQLAQSSPEQPLAHPYFQNLNPQI